MKGTTGVPFCMPPGACELLGSELPEVHPFLVAPLACGPTDLCEVFRHVYSDDEVEQGAYAIAERIKKGGYDIVVLNEVFHETARNDVLVPELEAEYPNILVKADTSDPIQDSGLMLFAKGHFFVESHEAYESCGTFAFPAVNWSVTMRTPQHGSGDCTYTSDDPSPCVDSSTNAPYATFVEYGPQATVFDGDDGSMANKGVAFVKLIDTVSGIEHAIFFTHTQAQYAMHEDLMGENEPFQWHGDSEFDAVFQLYNCLLEADVFDPNMDHIWLLGDLNVNGDLLATHNDFSYNAPIADNLGEWTYFFNSNQFHTSLSFPDGFFPTVFDDAWVKETPAGNPVGALPDRGLTDGAKRLDYILHGQPFGDPDVLLCNQHMSLAYNLRDYSQPSYEGGMDPGGRGPTVGDGNRGFRPSDKYSSDHLGLNANYNACTPQCTPLQEGDADAIYGDTSVAARVLAQTEVGNTVNGDPDPGNDGTLLDGNLEEQGALDWWRLDFPGQYLIGFEHVDSTSFRLSIYHEANMSEPIKDYRGERFTLNNFDPPGSGDGATVIGAKYNLLNPPYYIKVHADHDTTGEYMMFVHRLNCTDKYAMACPLLPNQDNGAFEFPEGQLVQSSPSPDSLYFAFDLQQTMADLPQTVRTVLSHYETNELAAFIVTPHDDDVFVQFEEALETEYPLQNTFEEERLPMNDFPISGLSWPACPSAGTLGLEAFPRCNNVITMTVPRPENPKGDRRLLRVSRVDSVGQPLTSCSGGACARVRFQPTWQTDLTVLPLVPEYPKDEGDQAPGYPLPRPQQVVCDDQNDGAFTGERDEIRLRMAFDTIWIGNYTPGNWSAPAGEVPDVCDEFDAFWLGRMDNGEDAESILSFDDTLEDLEDASFPNMGPRRFTDQLRIDVVEEDDCPDDGEPPSPNGPDVGTFLFASLSLDDYGPASAWQGVRVPSTGWIDLEGDGAYALELTFMHGTQLWEQRYDNGNLALNCSPSACTLTASAPQGSNVKELAVDNDTATYYESITASGAFVQVDFHDVRFVSSVKICPPASQPGALQSAYLGYSETGVLGNWFEYTLGTLPPAAPCYLRDIGRPAQFVRVKYAGTGAIAVADLQIFGY